VRLWLGPYWWPIRRDVAGSGSIKLFIRWCIAVEAIRTRVDTAALPELGSIVPGDIREFVRHANLGAVFALVGRVGAAGHVVT
jgi:hypothetical protein